MNMSKYSLKRFATLLLALALLIVGSSAWADTALVTSKAKVYASASSSATKLGTVAVGTVVERSSAKSGWAKIELNGKTGYVKSSTLTAMTTYSDQAAWLKKAGKLYTSCSTSSKSLASLKAGAQVAVKGIAGSWAQVTYGSSTGFVKSSLLTNKNPNASESVAYAAKDPTNVYDASGKLLGQVPLNTKVTVLETKNGISKVQRDGKTAYMYASDLSSSVVTVAQPTATPAPTQTPDDGVVEIAPVTRYVKADGAKAYDSKGGVIATLSQNTAVVVSATKGSLVRVSVNGKEAIMYASDLSDTKIASQKDTVTTISPTTYYVRTDGAKVYDSKGKVSITLSRNTKVTVSAYNSTLMRISRSGSTGYMYKTDLSATPVDAKGSSITEITPTPYFVKTEGAKLVSASGTTLGTLSVNTTVIVSAYSDTLAQVTVNSTQGYMQRSDLSATKVSTDATLQYGDTGAAVEKLQERLKVLGYFSGTVGGNYLDLTRSAVASFQAAAGITTSGIADEKTLTALFASDAPKASSGASSSSSSGDAVPAHGAAIEMDWWTSDIRTIFARGVTATITDVDTGLAWKEVCRGQINHADCQPCTAADTAVLKKVAGGSWSWSRRAIFVTINGVNYAASMNCQPHGSDAIKNNNFDGHHCIHFTNSRTNGSNAVDPLHQAAIKKAASTIL